MPVLRRQAASPPTRPSLFRRTWRQTHFTAEKDDTGYGPFYYMLQNDTEWKAGYKYTYNVTITLYGLQVSVDTDGMTWGDGADGEGSVELPV